MDYLSKIKAYLKSKNIDMTNMTDFDIIQEYEVQTAVDCMKAEEQLELIFVKKKLEEEQQ